MPLSITKPLSAETVTKGTVSTNSKAKISRVAFVFLIMEIISYKNAEKG